MYLCRYGPCLEKALDSGRLEKALALTLSEEEKRKLRKEIEEELPLQEAEALFKLLALAKRAAYVACGQEAVRLSIQRKKALALWLAEDASLRTKDTARTWARQAKIPLYVFGGKMELGRESQGEERSLLALENEEMLRGMKQYLENLGKKSEEEFLEEALLSDRGGCAYAK